MSAVKFETSGARREVKCGKFRTTVSRVTKFMIEHLVSKFRTLFVQKYLLSIEAAVNLRYSKYDSYINLDPKC